MHRRIGIDVGGTHTDFVLLDEKEHVHKVTKVATTPVSLMSGIQEGLNQIGERSKIGMYVNGTTVATNALLQHKFPRLGLITTRGFRDVLIIRRETKENIYDLFWDKPKSIVKRSDIFEVDERMDFEGNVLLSLNRQEIYRIIAELKKRQIEWIAICLLHSYANNSHEVEIKEIFSQHYPQASVSLSSEVLPEWREFERTYNTVLNTALASVLSEYLESLLGIVSKDKVDSHVFIMQANGGILGTEQIVKRPIMTLCSGVAGGVIGGIFLAARSGCHNIITFDVGGTSADFSVVEKGVPSYSPELMLEWEGMIRLPTIENHSVGAGGGSIAWLDEAGSLHVGPQSAGADPGPICYGKGGKEVTLTDGYVVLGYLTKESFLGGRLSLDVESAKSSIRKMAQECKISLEKTALGIVHLVNTNMEYGIRRVSIEKGYDPREFTLVAFGGAGGLHAAATMEALSIPQALIPIYPANVSSLGMVIAQPRTDFLRTFYFPLESVNMDLLEEIFGELEKKASDQLIRSNTPAPQIKLERSLDMRYRGQTYEINVGLPREITIRDKNARRTIVEIFHAAHKKKYAYENRRVPIMVVNVRVTAVGPQHKIGLEKLPYSEKISPRANKKNRQVYFLEGETPTLLDTSIYERPALRYGNRINGPAIIEEEASTVLVPPGFHVEVVEIGNLIMKKVL